MSKRIITLLIITAIFVGIFTAYPNLDIEVSSWFYSYEEQRFPLRDHPATMIMYYLIRIIAVGTTLWCFGAFIIRHFKPEIKHKLIPAKNYILFIFIAMILGPGLIVHQGFKDYFERARPVNITEFGGEKQYTAPFIVADQGGKSFISGHSAMGFFTVAFAFLVGREKRRAYYLLGIAIGLAAAESRIFQGSHFLSDVVFGGLVTLLTIELVKYWLIDRRKN